MLFLAVKMFTIHLDTILEDVKVCNVDNFTCSTCCEFYENLN